MIFISQVENLVVRHPYLLQRKRNTRTNFFDRQSYSATPILTFEFLLISLQIATFNLVFFTDYSSIQLNTDIRI